MFAKINENPVLWLEKYGDYLFGFALSRLHDAAAAEDLVQETLLAAWRSTESYAGSSSLKTWLTAILKHKILDYYRRAARQNSFGESANGASPKTVVAESFRRDFAAPNVWRETPQTLLENEEFRRVLRASLAAMPKNLAAVFTLREIEGLDGKEICRILNLSPNNFWVLLHRARLNLRQALQSNWFDKKSEDFAADKFAFPVSRAGLEI
jgi:RNA polymerase sigma-70 factor (TIGR02943 family)